MNDHTNKVQKSDPTFKVVSTLEYDADGTSNTWVQSEVLKVYPGGELYDIDTKGPLGRQTCVPEMFLRNFQSNRQRQGREKGYEIMRFDGLSESEDKAQADVEENNIEKYSKDYSKQKQKFTITFE